VRDSIFNNETTRDLGGSLSTQQAGAAICERLTFD
jgi:isocitrate/isopropylmalate dehydrogenase